jgi:HEAT repeat protein
MVVTREQVLKVVRRIEPEPAAAAKLGPEALPHLRKLVQDEDLSVASRSASVATKIHDRRAVPVVLLAADSPHPEVRLAVAGELWRLAEFDVAKPATRALADIDPAVRHAALRSLAQVSPASLKPALRQRIEAIGARDRHPGNRALATALTARLGGKVTAEVVRATLAAGLPVRELAPALGQAALPYLADLARARDVNVAVSAVTLAPALAAKQAAPVVKQAAEDRRPQVRAAAAAVANRVPGGNELLRQLLSDANARVREAAFLSAANGNLPGLKKLATGLARRDPDKRVRALAAAYLEGPRR